MSEYAERFTGRVTEYERYRLRYPKELLRLLEARCGLKASDRIADAGAGTGMLSELFLENGNAVTAIEPNAEMRAVCEELRGRYPQLHVMNATAEETTLADASVDFVTAGRAFHWFDASRALPEFRRILRPKGWLVIVANGRRRSVSGQEVELEQLLEEHGVDHRSVRSRFDTYKTAIASFAPESLVQTELPGEQRLTLEEFLGDMQSRSWAPMPDHPKYAGMQRALREYFARWSQDGLLTMATTCYVTAGQFADA